MKTIAGLGNPGEKYAGTPHSIGFEVVDALAARIGASWNLSSRFQGEIAQGTVGGVKVLLLKPQTFMNSSGDCVAPAIRYYRVDTGDLIVVSDDIDLPVGRIRIRFGGSDGGHNGLKSVISATGSADFARLRIGVGRGRNGRADVIGHVLGKFSREDRAIMDEVVAKAAEAAGEMVDGSLETAMNRYNGWTAPAAAAIAGEGNT